MKTIEKLEEEYNNYEVGENSIDDYEEFYAYLGRVIDNVERHWEDAFKQISENNHWKKIGEIRNLFPIFFVKEDTVFYEFDNAILTEASDLLVHNLEYYERIRNVATRSNFLELNKLLNFLLDRYEESMNYLNFKRDKLSADFKGTDIVEPEYDYNFELVDKFANKHISSFEPEKKYAYIKAHK